MMRVLKWLVSIFLVLIVVIIAGAYGYLRSTLPDYDGEMTISGLTGEIEIIRDSFAMPHIYARSDEDAFFALGYCMAQDRLFQMDMVRRAARGRLSEILGPDLVTVDRFFRTITAGRSIESIAASYDKETLAASKAYTKGVNYFIEHHKGPLPLEFTILGYRPEPWHFTDFVAVYYYMAWDLNTAFGIEMLHAAVIEKLGEKMAQDLFPDYPRGYPTIIPGQTASLEFIKTLARTREALGTEGGGASNNWVVSGKKSATGKPILASDPHLGHGAPGIWYEAHIVTPNMNASGSLLPGMPFIIIGANENVAWGMTNVAADDADFYIEKLNPANPDQYEYMGRWENMTVKKEVIKVKGSRDVEFNVKLTRHGPIIDEVNKFEEAAGTALAMRWTAYEMLEKIPFYYLNTARNIEDVEEALEYFKCPGQNFVYADSSGNIGFLAAVGIPIRDGFSGALPVPGWDGRHEWKGYATTAEQPHLKNPPRGWIATANNKHVDDSYPYPISHYYATPDRFIRIQQMLTARDKYNVKDFEKMHNDFYMVLASEWIPKILNALADKNLTDNEKAAKAILKDWNFVAKADEVAPLLFHATINAMVQNTLKKRMGDELYGLYLKNNYMVLNAMRNLVSGGQSAWFDDPDTPEVEDLEAVITKSFKDAIVYLSTNLGTVVEDWQWGKLHTLTIYHPFGKSSPLMGYFMNIGPSPMDGGIDTVNPQPYRLSNPWEGYHGASLRYIIDFANMKNSRRVIPAGISGNFMSPHYDDQFELWRQGDYRPFVLDRNRVIEDARYTMKMMPDRNNK